MEYSVAKSIRSKSLSSMVTEKIRSGGGVGSSIKSSISEKLKAKGTGIKEKFDPLNIAKFLTRGSNLAPAILGRLTGRSQRDINYFSGGDKQTAKKVGKIEGESGGSFAELFSFIKKNHEQDLKMQETERSFREERANEEARRHAEFLKALKGFVSGAGGGATAAKTEKEKGIFDFIKDMIADAIKTVTETISKMFSWINGLRILGTVAPWLAGLATAAGEAIAGAGVSGVLGFLLPAAAVGALAFLVADEMENIRKNPNDPKYKDNPYAMMVRGETSSVGAAGQKNIEKGLKTLNRQTVEQFVNSSLSDDILIKEAGASRETMKQWLQENPNPGALFRPELDGELAKQETARRTSQQAFRKSEIEQQNMTPASTATPATPPTADTATPAMSMATPVPPVPQSAGVYDKSNENVNLTMNSTDTPPVMPIVKNSVNNSSTEENVSAPASLRDTTVILSRVMKQSTAYV